MIIPFAMPQRMRKSKTQFKKPKRQAAMIAKWQATFMPPDSQAVTISNRRDPHYQPVAVNGIAITEHPPTSCEPTWTSHVSYVAPAATPNWYFAARYICRIAEGAQASSQQSNPISPISLLFPHSPKTYFFPKCLSFSYSKVLTGSFTTTLTGR